MQPKTTASSSTGHHWPQRIRCSGGRATGNSTTAAATCRTPTFTGAADVLGVSQASVSRTVAALERTLGARVLHRTTREVSLTAVGARVVGHARRVVEEVAAVRRAAEQG